MQEEEKTYKQGSKQKPQETFEKEDHKVEEAVSSLENMIESNTILERAAELFSENADPSSALEQLVQESRVRQKQQRFELVAKELGEALENNDSSLSRLESEIFDLAKELANLSGTFEQIINSHFGDESSQQVTGLKTRQQILELVKSVYEEAGVSVPEERWEEI